MENRDFKDKLLYGEFPQKNLLHLHDNRKTNKLSCLIELAPGHLFFIQGNMVYPNDTGFQIGISPSYSYKVRVYTDTSDTDKFTENVMSGKVLYETYIKDKFEVKRKDPFERLKNIKRK